MVWSSTQSTLPDSFCAVAMIPLVRAMTLLSALHAFAPSGSTVTVTVSELEQYEKPTPGPSLEAEPSRPQDDDVLIPSRVIARCRWFREGGAPRRFRSPGVRSGLRGVMPHECHSA